MATVNPKYSNITVFRCIPRAVWGYETWERKVTENCDDYFVGISGGLSGSRGLRAAAVNIIPFPGVNAWPTLLPNFRGFYLWALLLLLVGIASARMTGRPRPACEVPDLSQLSQT